MTLREIAEAVGAWISIVVVAGALGMIARLLI